MRETVICFLDMCFVTTELSVIWIRLAMWDNISLSLTGLSKTVVEQKKKKKEMILSWTIKFEIHHVCNWWDHKVMAFELQYRGSYSDFVPGHVMWALPLNNDIRNELERLDMCHFHVLARFESFCTKHILQVHTLMAWKCAVQKHFINFRNKEQINEVLGKMYSGILIICTIN